jgi:predicted ATPase
MLTRLKIQGFKNLVDVDVFFGPFTCIAGGNGVGKSNLFDAIRFLNALSQMPLLDAATSVRDSRTTDLKSLFLHYGNNYGNLISFEADMIVPKFSKDNLGRVAEATATYVKYSIELRYRSEDDSLEIVKEELSRIRHGNSEINKWSSKEWRDSVISAKRDSPLISTDSKLGETKIQLHLDRGEQRGGMPTIALAKDLPRTLIQAANAAEHRTAVAVQREMQSWRLLQLEPSAMREPDKFNSSSRLGHRGEHIPATLFRLARNSKDEQKIYSSIANRLQQLISDIRNIGIDRNSATEQLSLWAKGKDGTTHPARSLSEGTLRFLALTLLEQDSEEQGVLCLEEPENGIHPERIPAMLQLLKDIAVDSNLRIGGDNPLRQVIVNTHSPAVVGQVDENDLLVAEHRQFNIGETICLRANFSPLPDTWRSSLLTDAVRGVVSKGGLLAYLNPFPNPPQEYSSNITSKSKYFRPRRVIDRPDLRQLVLGFEAS